ncbi:methyltransferase domain-containing protein [Algisphaera agarilytica]|uniref:2-polyprenyl-3-methyl-5-hydroxy-6-metoxy-1, 4-benzoquinol methylase n=1 Tax=Algisphaera agarilytica TaxID=1385975 RepID=A0A7X0HC27_9BACT|nr:methyltransferase domain-containing protein [Algisphaera agarilytica]MBB6431664.1 2-polyprenyl-3-methyl-5-hydroxy-6-metoxy-1,4-benzoquinol methylase [Algisphaera agarilytica]
MDAIATTQPELPPSVSQRRLVPEVMDDPELDPALHEAALRGLGRINRVSRSAAMLWPSIEKAAARNSGRVLRVLDLACGGGDVLIQLARGAKRKGLRVAFAGADVSPVALDFAAEQARQAGLEIDWIPIDVFEQPLPDSFDLTMNSLFMHHLTAEQAVAVFGKMKAASPTVLINDLRRGPVAYAITVAGTRLLSRSPVVHVDGPRSVRAAWTPKELLALAHAAGLQGATVQHRFPWRMLLKWNASSADKGGVS